uniref:BAH domain-containing protein n=1 Tax=Palpitomonas bilix TaxID=652834 RepID=A0A7S3GMF1_9EUKA|mmetsp:Transcript_985/g.2015  ORF Transcript_985/g.2015 Transcript_985/m.2015 type:complete len:217 (+) Transcript_985:226-876(+)
MFMKTFFIHVDTKQEPCYIGRIVDIFKPSTGTREDSSVFIAVQWYYRPDETQLSRMNPAQKIGSSIQDVRENELFLSNIVDVNHIDTIVQLCTVQKIDSSENSACMSEALWSEQTQAPLPADNPPVMFFRFMYYPSTAPLEGKFVSVRTVERDALKRWAPDVSSVSSSSKRKKGPPQERGQASVSSNVVIGSKKATQNGNEEYASEESIESLSSED